MVGPSGVGKTCIAVRASKNQYQEQNPTIGFAFQKLQKEIGGQKMSLFLWDTAGQERYKSVIQMYYRGAMAAIIVYDVTSRDSFESAKSHVIEAKRNEYLTEAYFILVANKIDRYDNREVTESEGKEYANSQNLDFAEVSAKTNIGVHELFDGLARTMMTRHLKHIKRTQEQQNLQRTIQLDGQANNYYQQYASKCGSGCYYTQ